MKLANTPAVTLRGERVTLRRWTEADRSPFAAMNADPQVMRYLTRSLTADESDAMVERIEGHFDTHGYGLWALEVPELGFAGFVGIAHVPFALEMAGVDQPPREIGWRLARAAWGRGYATEGARLALAHGFDVVGLSQIVSFTTLANAPSRAVMARLGMTPRGEFDHPRLPADDARRRHVLYALEALSRRHGTQRTAA